MLQIKTIMKSTCDQFDEFDKEVNDALAEGWELVRRDVLPPYAGVLKNEGHLWKRVLYAELEREVEPAEEEEPEDEDDGTAFWVFSRRNPLTPFHCSACGHTADPSKVLPDRCPGCHREMKKGR